MTHYSDPTLLGRLCDILAERPSYECAAAALGVSVRSIFGWISASRRDEKIKAQASPYAFTWNGNDGFLHQHVATARRINLISMEARIREQVGFGIEENVLDSNHRQVWVEDAKAVALFGDDVKGARDMGYEDYPWAHDATGARIPMRKTTQLPATLRIKLLEQIPGFAPQSHQTIDVRSENRHAVVYSGGPGSPVLSPPSTDERVRAMIEKEKARAAAHLANPDRTTKPDAPILKGGLATPSATWPDVDKRGRTVGGGPQGFSVSRG